MVIRTAADPVGCVMHSIVRSVKAPSITVTIAESHMAVAKAVSHILH